MSAAEAPKVIFGVDAGSTRTGEFDGALAFQATLALRRLAWLGHRNAPRPLEP